MITFTQISYELHDNLSFGPALLEIHQRFLRLSERKHLINHRTYATRFEKFAKLRKLPTVWMHEQE